MLKREKGSINSAGRNLPCQNSNKKEKEDQTGYEPNISSAGTRTII